LLFVNLRPFTIPYLFSALAFPIGLSWWSLTFCACSTGTFCDVIADAMETALCDDRDPDNDNEDDVSTDDDPSLCDESAILCSTFCPEL